MKSFSSWLAPSYFGFVTRAPGGLRGLGHVGRLLRRDLDVRAGARAGGGAGLALVGRRRWRRGSRRRRRRSPQAEDPAADELEPLAPGGRGRLLALELHPRLAAGLLLLLTTGHRDGRVAERHERAARRRGLRTTRVVDPLRARRLWCGDVPSRDPCASPTWPPSHERWPRGLRSDFDRRRGVPPPPRRADHGRHVRMRRVLATDPGGAGSRRRRTARSPAPRWPSCARASGACRCSSCGPGLQSAGARPRAAARGRSRTAHGAAAGSSSPRRTRGRCAPTRAPASRSSPPCARPARRADVVADPAVRAFEPGDHPLAAAVDRAVRGAAHGGDLDALSPPAARALVLPGPRLRDRPRGELKILAAHDEAAAASCCAPRSRACRAGEARMDWLTAAPGLGDRRRARRRARAARGRRGVRARRRRAVPPVPAGGRLPVGSPS